MISKSPTFKNEKLLLDSLFGCVPGIIYLIDEQGKMLRWNRELELLSGFSAAEIATKNCLDFFDAPAQQKISHALATAVRIGVAELEANFINAQGNPRSYYLKAVAMRFQGCSYVAGVGIDLSQRKQLEEELRLHRDKLEQKVEERTADLFAANQELIAMNEEIQAINDELNRSNKLLHKEVRLRKKRESELQRRERQYWAAARLLTQPADEVEQQLSQISKDAMELLGAPSGYIGLFDDEKKMMERRHVIGPIPFDRMFPQKVDAGMVGTVCRTGQTLWIRDYQQYPDRLAVPELSRMSTVLMAPLGKPGQVSGVLAAHWLGRPKNLLAEDIEGFTNYANLVSAVLERMDNLAEMRYYAYHDTLTGMANRIRLNLWLEEEMSEARNGKAQGCLFFIDLDELKVVNDTFGHSIGDELILNASRSISEVVGKNVFEARIGGDEFIVVLPDRTDREEIAEIAKALLNVLSKDFIIGDAKIPMSASMGIVMYPADGDTVDDILKNADRAMYAAKNSGRNNWRFYEAGFQKEAYETMLLTNNLRRALERNEMTLHYQPKIRLKDQQLDGFEALLRWNSPEHGWVSPVRFVPLAEKSGLIVPVGQWALAETCRLLQKINRLPDLGAPMQIAVNISPRQLSEPDFVEQVVQILAAAKISPQQIQFEVTESLLIESLDESVEILHKLKNMGFRIALDDFGTGFSSLTYLRQLPVDTLKLDKSFIDAILVDETQAEFAGFIIEMAHLLKLEVVAEGVETVEQAIKLKGFGCDFAQGYVFSRPIPEEEVLDLLQERKRRFDHQ